MHLEYGFAVYPPHQADRVAAVLTRTEPDPATVTVATGWMFGGLKAVAYAAAVPDAGIRHLLRQQLLCDGAGLVTAAAWLRSGPGSDVTAVAADSGSRRALAVTVLPEVDPDLPGASNLGSGPTQLVLDNPSGAVRHVLAWSFGRPAGAELAAAFGPVTELVDPGRAAAPTVTRRVMLGRVPGRGYLQYGSVLRPSRPADVHPLPVAATA